jgi:phosphoribosylglycinamide formyltransferase-1
VTVVAVIAHREAIPAVACARALGLPVRIVPLDKALDRAQQDAELDRCLDEVAPDWIVLAGYMRILSAGFVARHEGRMVNIHPSLLPPCRPGHPPARAGRRGRAWRHRPPGHC